MKNITSLLILSLAMAISAKAEFAPEINEVKVLGTENDIIKVLTRDIGFGEGALYRESTDEVFFSDQPKNMIYRWTEKDGFTTFMRPAGFMGVQGTMDKKIDFGPNGIALDKDNKLVFCQQGHRRIARINNEKTFTVDVIADSYEGKKLNNTNDLCITKDGSVFFTDPGFWHTRRPIESNELDYSGIYKITPKGKVILIDTLPQPNGIDFSPDEKYMYIAQSIRSNQCWFVYELDDTKTKVVSRKEFCSLKKWTGKVRGAPDGMAIGKDGWIYATGNGGVHIFSPDLKHRGLLKIENQVANCCVITKGGVEKSLFIVGPKGAYIVDLPTVRKLAEKD